MSSKNSSSSDWPPASSSSREPDAAILPPAMITSWSATAGGETTVGRTAYRVVQEGLTNARKHAPAAAVDVSVSAPGGDLVVEVRSRPSTAAPASLPGAGTGLIGLAERVSLAGGELSHGREADGDFRLRAKLPWA